MLSRCYEHTSSPLSTHAHSHHPLSTAYLLSSQPQPVLARRASVAEPALTVGRPSIGRRRASAKPQGGARLDPLRLASRNRNPGNENPGNPPLDPPYLSCCSDCGAANTSAMVAPISQAVAIAPVLEGFWRGAGAVERDGLENRCTLMGTVGSNPTPSASVPRRKSLSRDSAARKTRCFKRV
jgi:hypothetical protein